MAKDINIEEYINSGQLEAYVLGIMPEEESRIITSQIENNPQLKAAVEEIEAALISYGEQNQGNGPKDHVLGNALLEIEALEKDETKTVPFTHTEASETPTRKLDRWAYLAVAATVLLLISIGLNFRFYNNWRSADNQLLALKNESTQLAEENQRFKASLETSQSFFTHISDKGSQVVRLDGIAQAAGGEVLLSWNPNTQQTLLVNYSLPELSEEQQYQLWAIIDGVPVDAGVIYKDQMTQFMKPIGGKPVQFAITVEPEGGSKSPTLEKMYAAGAVG